MDDSGLPPATASLLDWLVARGARFPGAAPAHAAGMGLGLVATRDLDPEDAILSVPRELWLTRKTARTPFGSVIDAVRQEAMFSHSMAHLALLVALEREAPDSFFRPYLEALGEPTVPYALAPAESAAIQGLPLATWIDEQRVESEHECAAAGTWLRTHHPDVALADTLDVARWRWAYGHVMQRTFSVDVEEDEVWVLVPGMDLCNHADEPNARYFAEEDGWYLEAARPIHRGESICIRYGRAKTSSDLLLYYGFVTPGNPNDRLHLELGLRADDADRAGKLAAIDLLGLSEDALVGADGAIPSAFLHAAILCALDSETFRAREPDVEDPQRAVAALECIAASIEAALASYPTTVAQDAALLEGSSLSGWLRGIVAYRLNVKQLHLDAAAAIRARCADIRRHGWSPRDVVEDDPDGRYGLATVVVRYGD